MANHRIAVIGGDGVGPEVTAEAVRAIETAGEKFGFSVEFTDYDLGGERYLRTGEVLPEGVEDELAQHDVILLGAIGTPDVPPGVLERGMLLKVRFDFDQYINLRPVKLYPGVPTPIAGAEPDDIDLLVLRENTEGMYTGAGGVLYRGTANEIATQESINTRHGAERIIREGFERAQRRRGHLTLCHKTNVLTHAGDLWQRTFNDVAGDYPNVETGYSHVDAMCLYLVERPEMFDVVVTDNLFGDIITDLGAAVQGGIGLAASGNLNPTGAAPSMFEPVHGSAPDIAGKGWANPVAAVLSAVLLLDHLGHEDAAKATERAAAGALTELKTMGGEHMGATTREIGDRIVSSI